MEPDPIRHAYDDYCRKVEQVNIVSFVDFTAGAKWSVNETLHLFFLAHQEGALSKKAHDAVTAMIRKHFGVEQAP